MRSYGIYSDIELLSFLRLDDSAAFTEIYNRYWKKLYALAYNRLRDIQIAEDIVHDVYTSLWNNRQSSQINNLSSYLATAVKYMILAHFRKTRLRFNEVSAEQRIVSTESSDFLENLHNKRVLAVLQQEIEKLPEKCKLIFKYSREENKSVKEIADKLQISTSTVENQLNKALGRLRAVFKNLNSLLFSIF